MKIEKIPPLKCPKCKSTKVTKHPKSIVCYNCGKKYCDDGKTEDVATTSNRGAYDPRLDTDDYLEGWITRRDD